MSGCGRRRVSHAEEEVEAVSTAQPERRVVFEDPALSHQIVIRLTGGNSHRIGVSCNCLKGEPIEVRGCFPAGDAIAVWRKHMEEIGEPAA